MIIGTGSLAKLLNDREGFIFFASGVSNSSNIVPREEFEREHDMLLYYAGNNEMLVYFSTISKFMKVSSYTIHKQKMETFVKSWFPNYVILNLGNVWECTNPNTFRNKMKSGAPFMIRHEYKFMISRDQLQFVTDNLPRNGKHEISIFGEMRLVKDCL